MSRRSQDTPALLGQVTGSVSVNKPAVPVELEPAGCWSACVSFREPQGLAVSIVVTTAEPRCLMGRHAVAPAAVHTAGFALFCSLVLPSQQHMALRQLTSNRCDVREELTCLC